RRHRRRQQGRVVEPRPRQELAPGGGIDGAVDDRHLDLFARAVVGDRDRLSHVTLSTAWRAPSTTGGRTCWSEGQVVVPARRQPLPLGVEHLEGGGHLAAGL